MSAFKGRFVRRSNPYSSQKSMLVYTWIDKEESLEVELAVVYKDDVGDWILLYPCGRKESYRYHDQAKSEAMKLVR